MHRRLLESVPISSLGAFGSGELNSSGQNVDLYHHCIPARVYLKKRVRIIM